jgi:hypothetical protein
MYCSRAVELLLGVGVVGCCGAFAVAVALAGFGMRLSFFSIARIISDSDPTDDAVLSSRGRDPPPPAAFTAPDGVI